MFYTTCSIRSDKWLRTLFPLQYLRNRTYPTRPIGSFSFWDLNLTLNPCGETMWCQLATPEATQHRRRRPRRRRGRYWPINMHNVSQTIQLNQPIQHTILLPAKTKLSSIEISHVAIWLQRHACWHIILKTLPFGTTRHAWRHIIFMIMIITINEILFSKIEYTRTECI